MGAHAGRRRACASAGLLLFGGCILAGVAAAADYSITGAVSFNGHVAELDDGLYLGSSYAPASGAIGAGAFKVVGATVGDGIVELTFDIGQSNSAGGQVSASGVATLSDAALTLTVTAATYSGSPIVVGNDCVFAPVHVALGGHGDVTGLHLAAAGFDVPSIDGDACNGFAAAIGNVLAGNDTAIALQVDGDFAPPGTIFTSGFEAVR